MDNTKRLGEESVGKLLLKFSIPAMTGMIVNALYNIVDRIFIGQGVGSLALSGLTICFPIMMLQMAFFMLIGIGSASLVSIKLGQKKKEDAETILGNAFVLLIMITLIMTFLGLIFIDPLLKVFGASDKTFGYAKDYLVVILLGSIFGGLGFGMNHIIRASGNPKISMYTMIIGAVINTILDPIFIFLFGWGVFGAALATIIGQFGSFLWVMNFFVKGKGVLKFHKSNFKLHPQLIKGILSIGIGPFSVQLFGSILSVAINKSLVTYGGDKAVAVFGIINSISMLIMMPIFGMNQGAQPIIGFNYGAQKYDRVKRAYSLAAVSATIITTIGFIFAMSIPELLIAMFNGNDKELFNIGVHAIRITSLMMPVIGYQIISSNYFQAVGKAKVSFFFSLLRQVIILLPLVLILPNFIGLDGVWYAMPISDGTSALITGIFLFNEMKKLQSKHEKTIKEEI